MEAAGFPQPGYVAGHSLGEYSALVAAGSISFACAARLVFSRGRYMQEAVPVGAGAMAAVIGAALNDVQRICAEASEGQVCAPANINAPNQIVIAGDAAAVDRATELLQDIARRVLKLKVSAPFHCALMQPAQERLASDLQEIPFDDLHVTLITNVDAVGINNGPQARDSLIRQVSSPVRWLESIELLIREGADTFVEIGPGKVLTGLARQISREVKCFNVEDSASLKQTLANLEIS